MRAETDLRKIKEIARSMLSFEAVETELVPIIKHPFTDYSIVCFNKNGNNKCIDLIKDSDGCIKWKEYMAERINDSKRAYEIYMMITKPYCLMFCSWAAPFLSQNEFSEILSDAWMRSEYVNNNGCLSCEQLTDMFKSANPIYLMTNEEYNKYIKLDETVEIYRGVTSFNKDSIYALSWTLNQRTAEWFASRFGENGTVFEAKIKKENIFALYERRNESEIIVDPKYLMDIKVKEYIENNIKHMT